MRFKSRETEMTLLHHGREHLLLIPKVSAPLNAGIESDVTYNRGWFLHISLCHLGRKWCFQLSSAFFSSSLVITNIGSFSLLGIWRRCCIKLKWIYTCHQWTYNKHIRKHMENLVWLLFVRYDPCQSYIASNKAFPTEDAVCCSANLNKRLNEKLSTNSTTHHCQSHEDSNNITMKISQECWITYRIFMAESTTFTKTCRLSKMSCNFALNEQVRCLSTGGFLNALLFFVAFVTWTNDNGIDTWAWKGAETGTCGNLAPHWWPLLGRQ